MPFSTILYSMKSTASFNPLRRTALILFLGLLGGCATLPTDIQAPSVSLADVSILDAGLLEQRYRLVVRIQNPNSFELPIDGVSYELELNEKPFAQGVSSQGVTVPRFGSETLSLDAVGSTAGFLRQLGIFDKGTLPGNIRYRLKGKLNIKGAPTAIPFDYKGEVDIPGGGRSSRRP